MQGNEIPIHDIKPLLEVEDYSIYYFFGLIGVAIILACGIAYLLYVWLKRRKAFNIRKEHIRLLKSVDLSDAKKAAYDITLYGATFKDDGHRQREMFKNLTDRLQDYKYKKEVDSIDNETLSYFELYKEMCDV
jgi:hypothetical protein